MEAPGEASSHVSACAAPPAQASTARVGLAWMAATTATRAGSSSMPAGAARGCAEAGWGKDDPEEEAPAEAAPEKLPLPAEAERGTAPPHPGSRGRPLPRRSLRKARSTQAPPVRKPSSPARRQGQAPNQSLLGEGLGRKTATKAPLRTIPVGPPGGSAAGRRPTAAPMQRPPPQRSMRVADRATPRPPRTTAHERGWGWWGPVLSDRSKCRWERGASPATPRPPRSLVG